MLKFNTENTPNVYIISDLHLTHLKIIKYCNRPYELSEEGVEEMKEDLLSEFDKLPATCTVINNGDLLDTKNDHSLEEVKQYVKRMKGPKGLRKLILVLGNHDHCKLHGSKSKFYYAAGFDAVYDSPIIVDDNILLSHEPVYLKPGSNLINFYGHTHTEDVCKKELMNNEGLSKYFMYDYDNWSMIAKVCRKDNIPEPNLEDYFKWPEKGILPENYVNVCWDATHKILDYKQLVNSCKH